jgi:hypothetical protein
MGCSDSYLRCLHQPLPGATGGIILYPCTTLLYLPPPSTDESSLQRKRTIIVAVCNDVHLQQFRTDRR